MRIYFKHMVNHSLVRLELGANIYNMMMSKRLKNQKLTSVTGHKATLTEFKWLLQILCHIY